ncbi:terpene synthase family protein [Nocardia pseudobrasiliensis]|uniref:Terpene synthase n=1 Tax=Nocardia pseudobrasiliensis TaxID=45979 RepID=A0A370HXW4_9NOCA|nr:hypothetical protein [Nocardia pseudobrasiliensis]RDI63358.1 hypothetical protein DFR76_11055 [Nocardia pseudobrasiliensis]
METTTAEITITLPPIYLPEPLHAHPSIDTLEARGLNWMRRYGFCDDPALRNRVIDSRTAHFFGYLCPHADPERLQPAVDWGYLMFVFDDAHCDIDTGTDSSGILDLAVRIVRTLEVPDADVLPRRHPFSAPIIDLARRLHEIATPAQIRRLADGHTTWLSAVAWQIATSASDAVTLGDYLFTRHLGAAAAPVLTLAQIAEREPVPEAECAAPAMRALFEMSVTAASIDDDLYSYARDLWLARHSPTPGPPARSLVTQYIDREGHGTEEALWACVELRDRIVAQFFLLRDRVRPAASPSLRRYLDNLAGLIRGNYEWGVRVADRYSNPDGSHPAATRTIGTVSDTPAAVGPPGIPAIDWWWYI